MSKGDIILIPFPFTDLSGNKLRPAVVLGTQNDDVLVCFITSQISKGYQSTLLIKPNTSNGLKKMSLIKVSKIATINKSLIIGVLGQLSQNEIVDINQALIKFLKLY